MKKENVIVKNQVILNRGLYRWAAPRSVFVRGLVNYRFQDLQRWLFSLPNDMRGRFQIKFAMTPVFNNSGFTLIELLVVVLIIGILAAVALPQYQKAVEKAQRVELLHALNTYDKAMSAYYLEHGNYLHITKDTLEIQMPTLRYFEYWNYDGSYSQDFQTGRQYAYGIGVNLNIRKKGDTHTILDAAWEKGKPRFVTCAYSKEVCKTYFDCEWDVNVCNIKL